MQDISASLSHYSSSLWKVTSSIVIGVCLSGWASAAPECNDLFAPENERFQHVESIDEAIFQYKALLYAVSKLRQVGDSNPTAVAALESDVAKRKSQLAAQGVDANKLILTAQDRFTLSNGAQIETEKEKQAIQERRLQNQLIDKDLLIGEWEPGRVLFRSSSFINHMSYSPNGTFLGLSFENGGAVVLNTATGQTVFDFAAKTDPSDVGVRAFAFSEDERFLFAASAHSTVKIFEIGSRKLVNEIETRVMALSSIAITRDNRRMVLTGGKVHMRSFSIFKKPWYWPFPLSQTEEISLSGAYVYNSSLSPDGKILASILPDGALDIRKLNTKNHNTIWVAHHGKITSLVFSSDSNMVGTSSEDLTSRIWDTESGRLLQTLEGHVGHVRSIDFSPDGQFAITGSADGTARIWRISNGEQLHKLSGHKGWVNFVKFSQDGRTVFTASGDGEVREWNYRDVEL